MQLLARSLVALGLLLGLVALVPLGATAQERPAPTVGEIVVDSYDCETGALEFHVYVTDLPHDPVDDGSLGYSIVGRYDQGPDSELPATTSRPRSRPTPAIST